ncbi:MAG: CHAT domain-containing protein [Leptolyngbyaceae cyanobacterium SL_7_1]|nr:CHAT domain-containing protein [Leptolyngbyaceae cyanobacterium SL_7_1]
MAWQRSPVFLSLLAVLVIVLCLTAPQLATPSVRASTSPVAQGLVEQGRSLYDRDRFADAVQVLQQAVAEYAATGDTLQQAIALSNLSLAHQQLGEWVEAGEAIATALELLQTQPSSPAQQSIYAQALMIQGRWQLAQGQAEQAYDTWTQATTLYQQLEDESGSLQSQINQAQALQAMGFYRRASNLLTDLVALLETQPDSATKVLVLRSLGDTLRSTGQLQQSTQALDKSLAIAKHLALPTADIYLSLANTKRMEILEKQRISSSGSFGEVPVQPELFNKVFQLYQLASQTGSPDTRLQAQLNTLSLHVELQQWTAAQALWRPIQAALTQQIPSRSTIYNHIDAADSLTRLRQAETSIAEPTWGDIEVLLLRANQQAQQLGDTRSQTYALGSLASLYEQTQDFAAAEELTRQALFTSQIYNTADLTYRWQWQLGRILKQQGDRPGAIAAYTGAVTTLQSLRIDLAATSRDAQFSFRESVEPIHRELVDLLLQPDRDPSPAELEQARKTIESLQLAELDNFFREACLDAKEVQIDEIDQQAAVIYPIILSDRLEVILSLPRSDSAQDSSLPTLYHHTELVAATEVENTTGLLFGFLSNRQSNARIPPLTTKLHQWLVAPFESTLQAERIQTLVFVLDGGLRNVPMAVLYDGQQYLIEKYSVALAPGLQLLTPQSLRPQRLSLLMAGLSQQRPNFPEFRPLPNVVSELQNIQTEAQQADISSRVLLDGGFTKLSLQTAIDDVPAPIVHLATHGKFSAQSENTFVLTWDGIINVNELDQLLQTTGINRRPIELLVLSACETAKGDDRAALGLAGVAVRAGARSTVATLWQVADASTALLMERFYKELVRADVSKAEALRRAQLSLLHPAESDDPRFSQPYFWSPIVLIGNWL